MNEKKQVMPKLYLILWLCFEAAYLVWMCFFLRPDTYPPKETGILHPWIYPIWIVVSAVILLLFPVYIRRFLYAPQTKASGVFALVSLIVGCGFITAYTFFKNPFDYTASMIGLDYPWSFKLWGILATESVFVNTLYMYRKYGFESKVGVIAGSVGCAALFVTINVPSAGEDLILNSLRCMSHWTGALMFAFGAATPVVIFLVHMAKSKDKRFILLASAFIAILALMLILLITVGKDGVIEGIPVWAVYIVLFLVNFTPVFAQKNADDDTIEKTPTVVS